VGPRIVIIGAGFGGIAMGVELRRAGFDSFVILEKADAVGGTWRDNFYPGAACDIPAYLYSFSFAPKLDWSRTFAEQPEILAYLEACVDRFDLRRHLRLGTDVTGAVFDEASATWRVSTAGGEVHEADVLITACGQLNRPAIPDLPGIESFAGASFHSARWRRDLALAGRRVGVVGTGASAIQFVPEVAAVAQHTTVFQRNASWILPKPGGPYSALRQRIYRRVPFLARLHRLGLYLQHEVRHNMLRRGSSGNRLARWLARRHLEQSVPPGPLRDALLPSYTIGCKRILISNDFYPALRRPNVALAGTGIRAVRRDGIETEDGAFHPLDVLIYGTGFHSTELLVPLRLVGRGGRELGEAWRDGAEAYLGMSVPGFPSLFLLYGPNTNLGHNSIIYMLESQVRYVLSAVRLLAAGRVRSLALRAERMAAHREEMRTRLAELVWDDGCSNWYKTAAGRNTNNWPGTTLEFRRRTRAVNLGDYEA
jgi:cation diffusion facilitator CzcD-associated flavoprotein CzcO